ncbi:MAG: hypothetical protein A2Z15_09435 [Chloroflexi bacterium RBG_16_50_11]|nr:MAG: hypothetical protein A2Z15_09435 [Chloroflexi bacterium RBG_16_50_11]
MKISLAGKTKNNKKFQSALNWLIVIALFAIVAANFTVWRGYFGKQTEIELIRDEIKQVNQEISQTGEPPSDLESKLQKAKDDLSIARQVFPENVDRTDVVDFILITAETSQVQIVPLVFDGGETEQFGQSYYALKFHGTVIGTLGHATNFITMLRNGTYSTILITEFSVERASSLEASVPDNDIEVTIDLSITLYVSSVKTEGTAS